MLDFFGNELAIGDDVALTPKHYRGLAIGKVVGFTAKQVRTEYTDHNGILIKFLTYPDTLIIKRL